MKQNKTDKKKNLSNLIHHHIPNTRESWTDCKIRKNVLLLHNYAFSLPPASYRATW